MIYLTSIKIAFLIFPFIALLITIPYILIQYHKYGSINKLRVLIIYSFILYLLVIYFLVILPLPPIDVVKNLTSPKYQLIPFNFIIDFIKDNPLVLNNPKTYIKTLLNPNVYIVLFNIIMTIPYGMYLNYYFKKDLKTIMKYTFLLSLFFELTQLTGLYFIYPRPYRLFDVDDLMINTLGGILGYFIMNKLKVLLPSREEIDEKSINDSVKVSVLRRITSILIDIFIYIVLITFINIFINNKIINYIILIIYFIIIPTINNKTLGMSFVNIKYDVANKRILRIFLRQVIICLYYIELPKIIFYLFNILNINGSIKIILFILALIILFIVYLISIIKFLLKKDLFYDKFLKVNILSTIKVDKNVIEE